MEIEGRGPDCERNEFLTQKLVLLSALSRFNVPGDGDEFFGSEFIFKDRKTTTTGLGVKPSRANFVDFNCLREILLRNAHTILSSTEIGWTARDTCSKLCTSCSPAAKSQAAKLKTIICSPQGYEGATVGPQIKQQTMKISRRTFLGSTAIGVLSTSSFGKEPGNEAPAEAKGGEAPLIVSTWPFGKPANEAALKVLDKGGSILDAVEQGIWVPESDPSNLFVGLSGKPNAAGVVQLDACIMSGPGHRGGSVAALEGIKHPISAARLIMEKTVHVMLVGEGARMFALENGLEAIEVNSRERYQNWQKSRAKQNGKPVTAAKPGHDTIALLVLGKDGNIAGGCSTSGLADKLPGRVGDSPILGSGLYVDNEVGAAGATGVGENVMRYCGSFLVVEYMRQGLHPQAACRETIRRIARQDPKGLDLSINFIALDKRGRYGAAGVSKDFEFAVTTLSFNRVLPGAGVENR